MKTRRLLLLLGLVCLSLPRAAMATASLSVSVLAPAEAPTGYVRFCASDPAPCRETPASHPGDLSPADWLTIAAINSGVNHSIRPATDLSLFGESEHWAIARKAGDCEDYVLLKQARLESLGFGSARLLITVVADEHGEGHAVLTVTDGAQTRILDNRRDDMLTPAETGYRFLKRQSAENPLHWERLTPTSPEMPRVLTAMEAGG